MSDQIDKSFTELCSERTIFSDEKGFFGEMFTIVRNSCTEKWLKNIFESEISDATKLKLLFDEPGASDMLLGTLEHVQSVYRQKDSAFSHERRKQGETLHRKGDLNNALVLLTQAMLRAPAKGIDIRYDGGLSLALALWSRSAVLLDLNRGEQALADIQCAIDNGLDDVKKQLDYYVRMAKANAMVGDVGKTKICLNLVKSFCGEGSKLDQIQNEVKQIQANEPMVKIQVPKLGASEHKHLHNTSSKLELRSSADSGNYVVATVEIKAGETIVVEKPIAACLLPTFFGSHCLHCLRRIEIAYGCPNCAGIAFCSVDCQKQACSTYHRYECKFMDIMIGSGMSILCLIALRMITQQSSVDAAIQNGRRVIRELCSHSSKRPACDYLQRTVMSAFLLRILQKANFFGRRTTESAYPNSEVEFQIGEILIGLLQVLQFNAHEIYETKAFESQNQVGGKKVIYIGAAIYNSAVYFNHSCYPDVIRYFVGTTIVLCASHPLQSGDMIAENYGPIFIRHPLSFRQRNLQSRYWFKCTCQPCRENWPNLDRLTNKATLRCANLKCNHLFKYPENSNKCVKCSKCNGTTNLEIQIATLSKAEDLYRAAAEYMDENRLKEAAKIFIDGINLFYSVAVPPHRDTHIAQDSLRVCLSNIGRI